MNFLAMVQQLPRTVWLIGAISLINDSASDMLYPLIPLYLTTVLMAGPKSLGLIEGIAEATASLLKLCSGLLYDRTQKAKPWLLWGYGMAGLVRPLIAFISGWPWLLVIRFADRVGKGLRASPRDALLANAVNSEQRGLAFGLHRAMDNAGAVIGPLAAALLLGAGLSLKGIFLLAFLPALLCLWLASRIKEPPTPQSPSRLNWSWKIGALPRGYRYYLAIVALFTLGNSSNMFLLMRAQELGVTQAHIPLLWAAVSAVATLFSTPLSALSDKYGRIGMLTCGYLAYGFVYLSLGFIQTDGGALFVLFALYGLFMAATEGVEKALVADIAPKETRGMAFGWFNLVCGVMLLPASLIFGWLYQTYSPAVAFSFSTGCAISAACLLMVLRPAFAQLKTDPN